MRERRNFQLQRFARRTVTDIEPGTSRHNYNAAENGLINSLTTFISSYLSTALAGDIGLR